MKIDELIQENKDLEMEYRQSERNCKELERRIKYWERQYNGLKRTLERVRSIAHVELTK